VFETSTRRNLSEAHSRSHRLSSRISGQLLATTLAVVYNWKRTLDDEQMRVVQTHLTGRGLPSSVRHASGLHPRDRLVDVHARRGVCPEGDAGYVGMPRKHEFAVEEKGYTANRHQVRSGRRGRPGTSTSSRRRSPAANPRSSRSSAHEEAQFEVRRRCPARPICVGALERSGSPRHCAVGEGMESGAASGASLGGVFAVAGAAPCPVGAELHACLGAGYMRSGRRKPRVPSLDGEPRRRAASADKQSSCRLDGRFDREWWHFGRRRMDRLCAAGNRWRPVKAVGGYKLGLFIGRRAARGRVPVYKAAIELLFRTADSKGRSTALTVSA